MANHTTRAQRINARQDKIYELALKLNRERDEKTVLTGVNTMFHVRDKRINSFGNAVFELYRRTDRGFDNHMATIEIRSEAPNGIKVLLGALTPQGKERAWQAIRSYEVVQ